MHLVHGINQHSDEINNPTQHNEKKILNTVWKRCQEG